MIDFKNVKDASKDFVDKLYESAKNMDAVSLRETIFDALDKNKELVEEAYKKVMATAVLSRVKESEDTEDEDDIKEKSKKKVQEDKDGEGEGEGEGDGDDKNKVEESHIKQHLRRYIEEKLEDDAKNKPKPEDDNKGKSKGSKNPKEDPKEDPKKGTGKTSNKTKSDDSGVQQKPVKEKVPLSTEFKNKIKDDDHKKKRE